MTTTFCYLPVRWLTLLLAQAIFWHPLWAQAEMLVPSQPGTALTQAGNGVPVLDIATPDAHGLSHNRFEHYNVGAQGLVLNNAGAPVVSQLGGAINGNPHLAGGPAGVILNEVTAANPSHLRGYTEVAGPAAQVIVANPYGITCDGCGFINTPRATLSTGRPVFGAEGQLERFSVEGGHVLIEGQGLNASNVDRFELLARAATINAKLYARDLKVVAGRNDIDVQTLVPTPHVGTTEGAPRVAIDSSALGGMYANTIHLVGTEAGVGVHLAGDLIASSGDLHLSADGQLTLARTAASGDLRVQGGDIVLSEAVHAGGNAHLKARGDLHNRGVLSAAGTLALEAGNRLANTGTVQAGHVLSASAAHLDNQGGVLESLGSVVISAGSLENRYGQVRALGHGPHRESHFSLAGALDNRHGQLEIASFRFALQAIGLRNEAGHIRHHGLGAFVVNPALLQGAGGSIVTAGRLEIAADQWTNSSVLQAGDLVVNVRRFNQLAGGQLLATGSFRGTGNTWHTAGLIASDGDFDLELDAFLNNSGRLFGGQRMQLRAPELANYGTLAAGAALQVKAASLVNEHGLITSGARLELLAQRFVNRYADVFSLGDLLIAQDEAGSYADLILNQSGNITSDGAMTLAARTLTNERAVLRIDPSRPWKGRITEIACTFPGGLDCGHKKREHVWRIDQYDRLRVLEASDAASITSGGHLTLLAGDFTNRSSSMATGGGVTARVTNFYNLGLVPGEFHTSRVVRTGRTRNASASYAQANAFNGRYAEGGPGFDPSDSSGFEAALARFVYQQEYFQYKTTQPVSADTQAYAAVVQAAGKVDVQSRNGVGNSVVRTGYTFVSPGQRTDTQVPGTAQGAFIDITPRLPAGLDQQQVDPTRLPGFTLPNGGGNSLFRLGEGWGDDSVAPPHSYLVETNPALTDLRQFLSTDYLLDRLEANPARAPPVWPVVEERASASRTDLAVAFAGPALSSIPAPNSIPAPSPIPASSSAFAPSTTGPFGAPPATGVHPLRPLRLGDGLYEQRLIQQAVLARTGQRWLDGLSSDQAQFKYLMDNALASQQALQLRLGVSLSAAQVSALSRDIVWLEARQMQGRDVLVPVLYLAQAKGGLQPAGALIQGAQVALESGALNNSGALKASESLAVQLSGSLLNSGLIQAQKALALSASDHLVNRGVITGQDVSLSAAGNLSNAPVVTVYQSQLGSSTWLQTFTGQAARVEAGRNLMLEAEGDVLNQGSTLLAGQSLAIEAGQNLDIGALRSEEATEHGPGLGNRQVSHSGSQVRAGADLLLIARKRLNVIASELKAGGNAGLQAGEQLLIGSAANEHHSHFKGGHFAARLDAVRQQGTTLLAEGAVEASAGQSVAIVGSSIEAGAGEVKLLAGQDLLISPAFDTRHSEYSHEQKRSSWAGFKGGESRTQAAESRVDAVGSQVSGDSVVARAGRDARISGSAVVATHGIDIAAGRDLGIEASRSRFNSSDSYQHKRRDLSGLLTGNTLGLDDITGQHHLSTGSRKGHSHREGTALTPSTVGASAGSVSLEAGRRLDVVASDLISAEAMRLRGRHVTVAAGQESVEQRRYDSRRELAVGRVVGGQVVDTAQALYQNARAARDADDGRLAAVKAAQAALAAYTLAQQGSQLVGNLAEGKPSNSSGSLIKLGTELGNTRQRTQQESVESIARPATLTAGGTLGVAAERDLEVLGSRLRGADTDLLAGRDILFESAQNRSTWNNQSTRDKAAIGASFNIGEQNGFTLDLGASVSKAQGRGSQVEQANAQLHTGTLTWQSGRHSQLAGAEIHAQRIDARVGEDLLIVSRQDELHRTQRQRSAGAGASLCIPPLCYGATVSASGSLAYTDSTTRYEGVVKQSGLFAGHGGFGIDVGGSTDLQGAVIASQAPPEHNRLSTERLAFSDIRNRSETTARSASLSASYSSSGTLADKKTPVAADSTVGGGLPLALSDGQDSLTHSAISPGTLDIRSPLGAFDSVGLSRDPANANQARGPPDERAQQTRLELIQSTVALGQGVVGAIAQAKQRTAQELADKAENSNNPQDRHAAAHAKQEAAQWKPGGSQRWAADIATGLLAAGLGGAGAGTTVGVVAHTSAGDTYKRLGDYADQQARASPDPVTKAAWAEGGPARVALHAAAGALQGLASGSPAASAKGAALSAALLPDINEALKHSIHSDSERTATSTLLAAVLGAASTGPGPAQASAAQAASGVEQYNRQLHAAESTFLTQLRNADPQRDRAWLAAACALAKCSAGVPPSAEEYRFLHDLQLEGAKHPALQASLLESGMFQLSWPEEVGDFYSRHERPRYYFNAGLDAGSGIALAAGSATVGGAACVGTAGLACFAAGAGVASGSSLAASGFNDLFTPFKTEEGQAVLRSLNPATHPGDGDIWESLKAAAVQTAVDEAIDRVGGRLVRHLADRVGGRWGGGGDALVSAAAPVHGTGQHQGDIPKPASVRSIQQLLPEGKVPGSGGGEFGKWFDELSLQELDLLWENPAIQRVIQSRIREPGGLHEWCMVCRAPEFKKWDVPMSEIQRFRTQIRDLKWTHPEDGKSGAHGAHGSGKFHYELKGLIDSSKSLDEFNLGVENLRIRWKIESGLMPELPRSKRD